MSNDDYSQQIIEKNNFLRRESDNNAVFALVATVSALLLVNLNTKEVIPIEVNRPDYYGISWFPGQKSLVLSHSVVEYASLTDFLSYTLSEVGVLSAGDVVTPRFLSTPHQIFCASDGRVICTNTGRNAISVVDLSKPGYFQEKQLSSSRWDLFSPEKITGDHLNSVFEKEGKLYVIAHGNHQGSMLATLSYPDLSLISLEPLPNRKYLHNIWVTDDGQRISCGSDKGDLIELGKDKINTLWKAGTRIFTRGLAASSMFVLIGESQEETQRELRRGTMSAFWLLDRKTWKALDYFYLGPYGGVHEIRLLNIPDEAHHGHPFMGLDTLLTNNLQKNVAVNKVQLSHVSQDYSLLLPLLVDDEIVIKPEKSVDINDWKFFSQLHHNFFSDYAKKIMLNAGWSVIEDWGVWSDGEQATFVINAKELPESFIIELSYSGFVLPTYPKQSYALFSVQGKLLQQCDFEYGNVEKNVHFMINKQTEGSGDKNTIFIIIKINNPIMPSTVHQTADARLLGFGLKRVKILSNDNSTMAIIR